MRRFTVPFAYIATVLTIFSTPLKAEMIEETNNESTSIEGQTERQQNALSIKATLQKRDVEGDAKEEEQHVEIGVRALPHAEWVQTLEMRQGLATQRSDIADTMESGELETSVVSNEDEEDTFEQVTSDEIITKAVYYTCHQGAIHRPIAVTVLGDVVTLEDGSEWIVKYSDRYKTLDWLASDSIIILQNHSWFSSYYFCLVNQMTGAKIEVNMLKGPIYNGVYTHWIIAIDYFNCEVCLEDGSLWRVASADYATLNKWLVNDTIILGIEDSWFTSKPNLLINVNMLNFSSAGPAQAGVILFPVVTP